MEDTKRIETATMVAEASLEAPKTAEQTLSALRAAQSAGGKKAHENLTPAERTERGKRAAAARWGAQQAAVAAISERIDFPQIQDLIGDFISTQPEFVNAPMMTRPMIVRAVLDSVQRLQIERLKRLGFV
jgi:chromosome segregation ATPase